MRESDVTLSEFLRRKYLEEADLDEDAVRRESLSLIHI